MKFEFASCKVLLVYVKLLTNKVSNKCIFTSIFHSPSKVLVIFTINTLRFNSLLLPQPSFIQFHSIQFPTFISHYTYSTSTISTLLASHNQFLNLIDFGPNIRSLLYIYKARKTSTQINKIYSIYQEINFSYLY